MEVTERLREIQDRIAKVCQQVGRKVEEVCLVGVVKGQPLDRIQEAVRAGLCDVGENYAQELTAHQGVLQRFEQIRWHFIGHLQRNKARVVLPTVALIHSLDSIPLAEEIDRIATQIGKIQPVLIELNLAEESTKTGLKLKDLPDFLERLNHLDSIQLNGLMTVPPPSDDPKGSRPYFAKLRETLIDLNRRGAYTKPLTELSMGMTHDFESAIEEGATLLRIGSGLLGQRNEKTKKS